MKVLFAFVMCSAFSCLTWTRPMQSTVQGWEQQLKESNQISYAMYMAITLAAASSGKSFLQRSEMLTDDCVRTARVTLNAFTTPSTASNTFNMVLQSLNMLFNDTSNQNPTEILCKSINKVSKQSKFVMHDFEKLKNQVTLPKPAKNYIIEVPQGANITELVNKPFVIDDPELIKLYMIFNFAEGPVLKAISALSRNDTLKSTVDAVFLQALDDYIEEAIKKTTLSDVGAFKDFAEKVDKYFQKNLQIKDEYKKIIDEYERKTPKGPVESLNLSISPHFGILISVDLYN